MLKIVQIIEKSSGHLVAQYEFVAELVEDITEEKEYCIEAWENAVEEGLVDVDNSQNYEIEVLREVPSE
jgi:hypothetical protein